MPFFAKAAIDALKQHPSLNAAIDTEKGEVTYYDRENLAIAVDTERGLLTPVIKEAGDLSIAGLARKIADVAERTRTNKITPDELSGGTFTLTNTGSRGALFDTPIINQPQVAILGTGAVVKRPVVIDDAEPRRDDRRTPDGLPRAHLRPPARRRRRRRALPDRRQGPARSRPVRGLRMHVVIGGASGFLGTHLTRALEAGGHTVTGLYAAAGRRRPGSRPGTPRRSGRRRPDRGGRRRRQPRRHAHRGQPALAEVGRQPARSAGSRARPTLAEAIAAAERKPAFLAGNGISVYGDHGSELLHRDRRLAAATTCSPRSPCSGRPPPQPARDAGARVCILRTAPVMDVRSQPLKSLRRSCSRSVSAVGSATGSSTSR